MKSILICLTSLFCLNAFGTNVIVNPMNGQKVTAENFERKVTRYMARYYLSGHLPQSLDYTIEQFVNENPEYADLIMTSFVKSLEKEYFSNFFKKEQRSSLDLTQVKKIIEQRLGQSSFEANMIVKKIVEAEEYSNTGQYDGLSLMTKVSVAESATTVDEMIKVLNELGKDVDERVLPMALENLYKGKLDQRLIHEIEKRKDRAINGLCHLIKTELEIITEDEFNGHKMGLKISEETGDSTVIEQSKISYVKNYQNIEKLIDITKRIGLDESARCKNDKKAIFELVRDFGIFFDDDLSKLFQNGWEKVETAPMNFGGCEADDIRYLVNKYYNRAKKNGVVYNFGEGNSDCQILIEVRPTPLQKLVYLTIKTKSSVSTTQGSLKEVLSSIK